MLSITIEPGICKRCGLCASACPDAVFLQKEKGAVPEVVRAGFCISCGQCAAICLSGALKHSNFGPERLKPVKPELKPSAEQVLELLHTRRSIRNFLPKPVEKEVLESVVAAGCYAGSGSNTQSTHYLVVQDKAVLKQASELARETLGRWVEQMRLELARNPSPVLEHRIAAYSGVVEHSKGEGHPVLFNAPAVIVFHANKADRYAVINATLALSNVTIACSAFGLGACFAGFVAWASSENEQIRKVFALPDNHLIYGVLSVGYPKARYKNWIERKPAGLRWM
jgi:nitroreductase/NAD-dependent dihydropyrimidine dehydrogenase PreA subunit